VSFDSITNRAEFFSDHYLDSVMAADLGGLRSWWEETEADGRDTARSRLRGAAREFFAARAAVSEASRSARADAVRRLNDVVLGALGFSPSRTVLDLKYNTTELVSVPVAAHVDTSSALLLVALDAGLADDVDDLFDDADGSPGRLLEPLWRHGENKARRGVAEAVGDIFACDEPPRYVLVCGGRVVLLAERAKWAEGRFLAVDLDVALERMDTKKAGEIETIAALFSADALVPCEGQSTFDELTESSHKHAVGVSKELRERIRESIEILANEVIQQRLASRQAVYEGPNRVDPRELTMQCLRYLYRLLVLLYAESRPELGILPVNDEAYLEGYSLDRLRELCLVELDTDRARNGTHIDESLRLLFRLVNDGYHAEHAEQQMWFDSGLHDGSRELFVQFPGLDAALFEPAKVQLLDSVSLRNEALQRVLRLLMLSPENKKQERGFISYAQLGINQLGAVYEGLMSYTGFFADRDLCEVAKGGDPKDGTWVLPVEDAEGYPDEVFVTRPDPLTGRSERVRHPKGSFVFRLSGRERQRSASYYTPEVLTRCVVKHALAELLGTDDHAPPGGSLGLTEARQILDITICEPALGSGAFLNEAINQLSAEYLRRRQAELGEQLDPERYNFELQKVKAHFALHQSYGVDLNSTAVELAEVSLWLNAMYPGLKAPWFGLQLRRGNSLVGCRRATWKVKQLGDRPWAQTKSGTVMPPVDRPLTERLQFEGDEAEIHHFLLPGHGWAAVADRKEAKELRPDEVDALKAWRKNILKAPSRQDAARLVALAQGVEDMWERAAARIALTQMSLRRPIDLYGATVTDRQRRTREGAMEVLNNPDSPLGRLRVLMDAWIGLWFWPLDSGVRPPSWNEWLQFAEELVRPDEAVGLTGQLDLFDDLEQLLNAEEQRRQRLVPVAELEERFNWLRVAREQARREGAWHWELEFAPVFQRGGFELQVGNPPWVRPRWQEDLVLAEHDPWWAVAEKQPVAVQRQRRAASLAEPSKERFYLGEVASSAGLVEYLGSPQIWSVLVGVQTNLYMSFMDTVWRHSCDEGVGALLHPEGHFTDPNGGALRAAAYQRLRRHFMFYNEAILFEDVHHHTEFSINVYGAPRSIRFLQASTLLLPDTIDRSLEHDGAGELPGIQRAQGGWDTRPHGARVLTVTEDVLADWAKLFDEPGTPASQARLLRPVTTADLEALSVLADQPVRLADHDYWWSSGWHEKGAKTDGTIEWRTEVPASLDEVILQGPHLTVATPYAKQPNENCQHNQDYSDWDLESLPERVIPRTNYQRACDPDTYAARLDTWNGRPSTSYWRVAWRAMTQPGLERSLHAALIQPGPHHVGGVFSLGSPDSEWVVGSLAFWNSLPLDYLVKVSGVANVKEFLVRRFPGPSLDHPAIGSLMLRALRLNCLTVDYAPLWEELFDPSLKADRWTTDGLERVSLGEVDRTWSMTTPLRRDQERRQALVEIDALAALMLGLTAEQLCAMYRTQFAVLRKYEHKMVFDSEGRKICGYHQSAGYRQAQLQEQAKAGDLPKEWTNLWALYERWEDDPDSVDWMGHFTPPFYRADRETEMTRAYEEFQRRLEAGEYESP